VDKDTALLKLIEEIIKTISQDRILEWVVMLAVLYLFAQALSSPFIAWYTARRQKKVDSKLTAINDTVNGTAEKPAAVERVIEKQDHIIERLARVESNAAETRADIRALRDGQREILTEVRSQLAYHSDEMTRAVERLLLLSRDEAAQRRKARRMN